jgi:hypothetical protein
VNGALTTWTLPNYLIEYLGMLSLMEVLFICGTGLIFVGLTALLSWRINGKSKKHLKEEK